MAFISMVICLFAIIKASGDLAVNSTVNSFGTLWAKSILGEYDIQLKDRYGILGFYGERFETENKLKKYVKASFKDKEYIEYENPLCCLEKYSLANTENLKEQIDTLFLENTIKSLDNEGENDEQIFDMREINNSGIINNLPSYGKAKDTYLTGVIKKIKAGVGMDSIVGNATVDKYIFCFFRDYMESRGLNDTYFMCEVEYIISGKLNDYDSQKDIERKILSLRNVLNLYYLYTCPSKRDSAMVLAQTLTPGAAAPLTQAVILEAWAFAEAHNDLKILYDNKAVPLLKKDSNWALSLENVFNQDGQEYETREIKYVLPKTIEGAKYTDYLKVMLCGVPEETKLLRIMDLIQINMKYTYCDYFLLKDYFCGVEYSIKVNGFNHEFEDSYY